MFASVILAIQACSSDDTTAVSGQSQLEVIDGQVDFSALGALPRNATLHVEFVDVTDGADAAAVLAESQTGSRAASPYAFELLYDPAIIRDDRIYRVRAMIRKNGEVISYSAPSLDPFTTDDILFRFEAAPGPSLSAHRVLPRTVSLQGTVWRLAELDGNAVDAPPESLPTLEVSQSDDSYAGFSGCNRYSGSYELDGTRLKFGTAALTKTVCEEGMELEARFLEMLGRVGSWHLDSQQVVLGDTDRNTIARFKTDLE
jgi:putative lipoprotein